MTTYPIVLIEWRDACSLQDGAAWHSDQDAKDFRDEGAPILSVGIEVLRDKRGVVIAGARHNAQGSPRPWGQLFFIPGAFVEGRKVLGKVRV